MVTSHYFQLNMKGLSRKVVKRKSATVNLENLLMEKYLREKENKKNSLEVAEMKYSKCNNNKF